MCKSGVNFLLSVVVIAVALCSADAHAQFNGSIQGTVADPTGAVIPRASVALRNVATGVSKTAVADSTGVYRFASLGAGDYEIKTTVSGYNTADTRITLQTDENRNVALVLTAGSVSTVVDVTSQAPLLNTSETRLQLTLTTQAFDDLPLNGRNFEGLILLAPGVTGHGNVSPGGTGAQDNFNIETNNQVSANGRGSNGNLYVLDGLDITSNIRPGVLNLSPNPDAIAEVAIQPNTFTVDYGRASSIQTAITTRSGSNEFHGFASDYFTNQRFQAYTHFAKTYLPYHSDNFSAGVGGPIIKNHTFFFFTVEPLRSVQSNGGSSVTFEDPAFTAFAKATFPNTVGTQVLSNYGVANVNQVKVAQTAAQAFPQNAAGTSGCGTATTNFLPCATPVFDTGNFNSSSYRNGTQYGIRIDQNFSKDRIYGTYFRTSSNFGSPNVRPAFTTSNTYSADAPQVNETHTFSPRTLNEAAFSFNQIRGSLNETGDFSVPVIFTDTGLTSYGIIFPQGVFQQQNYHWRDVLTHIVGNHSLRAGYDGTHANDLALFAPVYRQPIFDFRTILDLAKDNPYNEDPFLGLSYNPVTGQPTDGQYQYGLLYYGFFAEDTYKVNKRLTFNYGLRFDNFGNPKPIGNTVLANFYLGSGNNFTQQVGSGGLKTSTQVFGPSLKAVSPRIGVAFDTFGNGRSVIHGGFGVYHDAPTLGNEENGLRGNPPAFTEPTFNANSSTSAPIFALGTSKSTPQGFPYPKFGGTPLNAQGGLVGQQINIGGIDRNLSSPYTLNYNITLEQQLVPQIVFKLGYEGSNSRNLLSGGGSTYDANVTAYGVNVNKVTGDLFQQTYSANPRTYAANRPNPSFGAITYAQNAARANYNSLISSVQGRFGQRAFLTASYTWGHAMDNEQIYPDNNLGNWYSRSPYDVTNAFSFGGSYRIPGYHDGHGLLGRVSDGFTLAGTVLLQSGTPFTVSTSAGFQPVFANNTAGAPIVALSPTSGDYNGDGDNYDYPSVLNTNIQRKRPNFLNGLFPGCSSGLTAQCSYFTLPQLGQEGNERPFSYRNPPFYQSDLNIKKVTRVAERVNLELRLDIYNLLNQVNLTGVDANLADGQFGQSTSQFTPRNMDVGAKITF